VDQSGVLIISDDPAFSRAATNRWRGEAAVPEFTVLGSDRHCDLDSGAFDLAIVGGVPAGGLSAVLRVLALAGKPVILVVENNAIAAAIKQELPRAVVLHHVEGWSDTLVMVGGEVLMRIEASRRLQNAETARAQFERDATLGRYVLEMRHGLNNALTSILGNSELLLLEPGDLSPSMISQLGTIRNMALRIHETVQRFSSLEKEMTFVGCETLARQPRRQAAGACD
jgi:signal transduction histidine kinase